MIETPSQLLVEGASLLHVDIDERKTALFMEYLSELKAWNERFNLTAITDDREIVVKHFLDSLSILAEFDIPAGCSVVDIGTGAGFPGVPIKIIRPDIKLTLLESSAKKAGFLEHIVKKLSLDDVGVAAQRAEDFGRKKENREKFCLAVTRAVASIAVLAEYALPLLEIDGRLVIYKAKRAGEEASQAGGALNLLGGRIEEITKVMVPFLSAERYLVSIKKTAQSPQIYPRKAGMPVKKPLI